jgi:hypothetical protein
MEGRMEKEEKPTGFAVAAPGEQYSARRPIEKTADG